MENQERNCENCFYYDTDRKDQPCFNCSDCLNWQKGEDKNEQSTKI